MRVSFGEENVLLTGQTPANDRIETCRSVLQVVPEEHFIPCIEASGEFDVFIAINAPVPSDKVTSPCLRPPQPYIAACWSPICNDVKRCCPVNITSWLTIDMIGIAAPKCSLSQVPKCALVKGAISA